MTKTRDPMEIALKEARRAADRGEVPIGACLVGPEGEVIASDGNRTIEARDPTAHAEMLVIREAARLLDNERLLGCKLYVTLEPCAMCAGAISFARIEELVIAADDPKGGGVFHGGQFFNQATCHHRPTVTRDHRAEEAGEILRSFFKLRREGRAKTRMSNQ